MAAAHRHLALFARFPAPGHAKTRLIPRLGIEGASAFARAALLDILHLFSGEPPSCRRTLFYTPSSARSDLIRLLCQEGLAEAWSIHPQADSHDLGSRLSEAVAYLEGLQSDEKNQAGPGATSVATLIGMDCFDLTCEAVDDSMTLVSEWPNTAHMIGAADGGYVLLTVPLYCSRNNVFEGIAWSCDTTGQEQKEKLEQSGLLCLMGEALADVDEPEDLDALWKSRERKRVLYPRTMSCLEEIMGNGGC